MGDLGWGPNRYFYLEEISIDDLNNQKESTLIPVASVHQSMIILY